MNSHPSDPSLTPEERELAQRLSRLGGTREPPPALDARILAAAHDAVQASTSKRRRSQRRWPVGLGVAASLALAVGIAWQLRPLPDAAVEYSEAPAAVQDAAGTVPESATAERADGGAGEQARPEFQQPATALSKPAAAPEPPEERKRVAEPRREARADAEVDANEQAEAGFAPTPEEPVIVFDEPSPVETPAPVAAPVAPPPPAPPSPAELQLPTTAQPATAAAGAAKRDEAGHDEARRQRARNAPPRQESSAAAEAEAASASALDRVGVTGANAAYDEDQPLDDRPPASADSPQVQQAWLQRIRELVARGQFDDARASLAEYRRRYPDQPVPDDLRALDE
jgi:resuscitation-promoting factor RpfA